MNLKDLPDDILHSIKVPVTYEIGKIYIEPDTYSNFLVVKNNDYLSMHMKCKIKDYITSNLIENEDYETGCTWSGYEWDHGPTCWPIKEDEFLRFVMPAGFPTYNIYQNRILDKIAKLIDSFSVELYTKCISSKLDTIYLIYSVEEKRFNFNKISKNFVSY